MTEEIYLFNDTETTGFKKNGQLVQEGQARVCQLALLLTDSRGRSLAKFSSLIKPDGWTISEGAQKVHGITMEDCQRYGMNQKAVVNLYIKFCSIATLRVAHNDEFDNAMMEIEQEYASPITEKINTPSFCTMKRNTHINPAGKWPKLEATLQHYTGRSLGDTAHDAMFDAEACRDIFFAMRAKEAA